MWLLEELEVPYELVRYKRDAKTLLAPPELAQVHPLGKSPVVTDDGRTIAESGAILEYLAETHGKGRLLPAPGTPEQLRCRYFMHYAEGSLMPPLLVLLLTTKVRSAPLPFFVKPVTRKIADGIDGAYVEPNLVRHSAFIEAELSRSTWLAGEALTIADIQMSYPVEALVERAPDRVGPKTRAYVERIHARPAYRRAIDKGGEVFPVRGSA
ncbi:MAG TPA: glutathione S-transferase [Nannocystaceae bacterium]|nr:glutathione S-transferase [Nannocystaceae bacterium]